MKKTYFDLINQSYDFPQEGFDLNDGSLNFHGFSLQYLIEKYGTPFKVMYLPRIGDQINKARDLFSKAMAKHDYDGTYYYCYCTKCCHYSHVIKAAVRAGTHLETSSSFDIDLIKKLHFDGEIDKEIFLIHNGYKSDDYLKKIFDLNQDGFINSVIILDSKNELTRIKKMITGLEEPLKIGIRMAIDEEPNSSYKTSRLGIRADEILNFYKTKIRENKNLSLEMLHFFIDSGIKDNLYYWREFQKAMDLFVDLKKICPALKAVDLGGGFPVKNNLEFKYDYENIIDELVGRIKSTCLKAEVIEPDIFTEFGKYTVGESGAVIFSVMERKQQNETELWYMVNNSLMNTIPDAWYISEKFILLPVNKWENEYTNVNIGGISCDHLDYYNFKDLNQQLVLPRYDPDDQEPLYVGFFYTGAYQDAVGGYGGIKHCLIPSPKVIIVDRDENGNLIDHIYRDEQTTDEVLTILGYNEDK